jgi:RimJ/RimL family protein N-acetyltransferase
VELLAEPMRPTAPGRDDRRMNVFLQREPLVLRELTADDVNDFVELDVDPELVRWTPDGSPSREEVEQQILPYWRRFYVETPGFGFWAAEEMATGEFLRLVPPSPGWWPRA